MLDESITHVDHFQLQARGWTQSLIKRFLSGPDRWGTVNHWANFKGKALYSVERVMLAEANQDFKAAYDASTRRRRLSDENLALIGSERIKGNEQFLTWLKTLSPEQIRIMLVADQAAEIFQEAIDRGYRTPNK
jgi:hypothetical protein